MKKTSTAFLSETYRILLKLALTFIIKVLHYITLSCLAS